MKKIFIIFLFIIFSSSFSLAKNNEKITVEEIEDIFFGRYEKKKDNETWQSFFDRRGKERTRRLRESIKRKKRMREEKNPYMRPKSVGNYQEDEKKWEEYIREMEKTPRFQNRGIAKCMYWADGSVLGVDHRMGTVIDHGKKCLAKVIRVVTSSSEKGKKRRPGDIFYALDAIKYLVDDQKNTKKFVKIKRLKNLKKVVAFDKGNKPLLCVFDLPYQSRYVCRTFAKSTLKKIEKFKKDPSNEKVLGHALINNIKNVKMVRGIREKLGTDNYVLLGDMLNATVRDVEKNNISPDLQKRRALLKKYSLILRGIKKKLDEDNYKSIEKDVSKLSKTYKDLKSLTTTNEMIMNIDEAVSIIFDTNKLIQKSVLNSKDSEEEKLLALSSIYFMQSLIDSILSTIPEKYYVYTKELPLDLFAKSELLEIEDIIDTMINKNKEIKSAELTKSMDIINKYINATDLVKTLDNLGMKNSINRMFTHNTATEIVNEKIRDNLDKEIFKEARKIFQEIDRNELSEITNELSEITKEVSDVAKEVSDEVKDSESFSILDKKIGSTDFTLKQIIHASRTR